jgi:hypothetical protein
MAAAIANAQVKKSQIEISGNISVRWPQSSIQGKLDVGRVQNYRRGGKSGTLYLDVWLTKKNFKGKKPGMDGIKVTRKEIGTLAGGYYYSNLSYEIYRDPTWLGEYKVYVLLVEYDPSFKGSHRLCDYYSPGKITFNL